MPHRGKISQNNTRPPNPVKKEFVVGRKKWRMPIILLAGLILFLTFFEVKYRDTITKISERAVNSNLWTFTNNVTPPPKKAKSVVMQAVPAAVE